ncbi:NAD(P)/FAD-dependent oxidoreductase [Blastococcus aurantiacus]|uniref:NAD(P)/FAD-dependent oxidoreductase n=1 Tax=Blastococcus aurantiacus TaxID=1550231 RepID=UPI001C40986C|nr:FAD-dependent oxidoreductase [Blastococcus aurantiacus]
MGASLAGLRAAEALRAGGFDGSLHVVGDEVHEPYARPPLSKALLAGAKTLEELRLPPMAAVDASWHLGATAVKLDISARRLLLHDGTRLSFDALLIATGARPRRLAAEQIDGVHVLRTLDDARRLRTALLERPTRVTVVGGGFIGLEVAATARQLGLAVTLVDGAPLPMLAAVGNRVAAFFARQHRRHGVDLRLGIGVTGLQADTGQLSAVELADGTRLTADLAVVGLGTVPNNAWLRGSGLLLDGGVRTDAALRVLDKGAKPVPGIVAAGDVARTPHTLFDDEPLRVEHWTNAVDQAGTAARTMLHHLTGATGEPAPYIGVPSFWSDQYDTKILSVGLPALGTESRLLEGDPTDGRFLVGYGRRGRLVGAVAVGHARRLAAYRRQIAARGPWPPTASATAVPAARFTT